MIKWIIPFILTFNCYAGIYDQIKRNNPNLNHDYIVILTHSIKRLSLKYNINPTIYSAILAQESMYSLSAKNCKKGLDSSLNEVITCYDFGIAQINYKTAKLYKLNLKRLTRDLDYSLEAGLMVLSDLKKTYGQTKDWWVRYNVGTGKEAMKSSSALEYKNKVGRFL